MNPTNERELKLDINADASPKISALVSELIEKYRWPVRARIDMINYDRYFDQLQPSGLFLLHGQDAYIRVRKSVWPQKSREAEFIAYRKLNEASYGKPAEIYDNEISVLKTNEIIAELLRDHPEKLCPPSPEAIGVVEHLESMGLSEIIRLKCERCIYPISYSDQPTDQVKIKIDRVTYKARPNEVFTQVEIDYYSNELFDMATKIMEVINVGVRDITGVDSRFSSVSKMSRGIELL